MPTIQVLVIVFTGIGTLGFTAPLEALPIPNVIAGHDNKLFNINITVAANLTTTSRVRHTAPYFNWSGARCDGWVRYSHCS